MLNYYFYFMYIFRWAVWKADRSGWRSCSCNSAGHMGCRGEIKTHFYKWGESTSAWAAYILYSTPLFVCVCVSDWQRMGSGVLHADRWCIPVAVLYNWPGLVPESLRAPDNPASLSSCPAHTNHSGGEQVWPGATQRGVIKWWGDTILVCLCVMNFIYWVLSTCKYWFFVSEGRACAAVFDCKFIETSAAMQHNVWEAFHGIVRQLRLRRDSKEANKRRRHINCNTRRESLPMKAKRFFDKVVAKNNPSVAFWLKSKSCHDLSVL